MESAKLDRQQIVEAALAIMQHSGVEALSMRKLAAELNIRAPTLYWYFPDRSAILHAAIKTIFTATVASVPPCDSWQEWLRAFGRRLWATNKTYQFGIILLQSRELNDTDVFDEVITRLTTQIEAFGIDRNVFLEAQSHIQALTVGWAVFRQGGVVARLGELFDVETEIERGIDGIVEMYERRLVES